MGHLAMSWSDNIMYQNAFSMQPQAVRRAYFTAPLYWLVLPIVGGSQMLALGVLVQVLGSAAVTLLVSRLTRSKAVDQAYP